MLKIPFFIRLSGKFKKKSVSENLGDPYVQKIIAFLLFNFPTAYPWFPKIFLNEKAQEKYGFERIIFQKQENKRYGIILHSRKVNKHITELKKYSLNDLNKEILDRFNKIFKKDPLINALEDCQDISIMQWRASQPSGLGIPLRLQICNEYNIAFCGDWFDMPGFGRVEGAILSSLILSEKLIEFI